MKFDGMPGFGLLVVGRRTSTFETGLDDGLHYAKYASYETRLMSFRINGEIDSRYSSEEFARAGLFRTGEADECACFHCGNLICGWEYEDDPLEQHAKYSLNCPFVERARAQKKMRMAEASVGDGLRKLDVPLRRPLSFWSVGFCAVLKKRPGDFADDHEYYRDDVMKTVGERLIKIADLIRKMREEDFMYSSDLIQSPSWNRGSLKQVIQTGNICQPDEYCRGDCFEVLFTNKNDMQKKSENLDGQNENVRKGQTDTSPRNADTGSAPEERDVQDEDVDEEIRALEQLLMCKVCLDKDSCIVFFPCRHMATCESCERFLERCPVCRASIDEAVKINEE